MKRRMLCAISGYLRQSRFQFARWRLELLAIRLCREFGADLGERTVRTKHGFAMMLDLSDWVDQHIFATGDYEPEVVRVVRALLNRGGTVIDVGANVGFYSLLFGQIVGPTGRVVAFEPMPQSQERLLGNLAKNSIAPVLVRNEALSDTTGETVFYCGSRQNSGLASIRRRTNAVAQMTVSTVTLDEVYDSEDQIDLIKLDIEGGELKAIKGMRRLLERWHPDLIVEISESYLRETGSSASELCDLLSDHGYQLYQICWDGIVRIGKWHSGLPDQFNGLFTARDSLPMTLKQLH